MKKVFNWIKKRLPTKRRLIQLYAALLFNANIKGFFTGNIYKGPLKNICTPGLNCYSCPGASGACPLGALQNALTSSNKTIPYYVFGIIMLYGVLFGRWICGFLCPFGLIQELLHKIPTPKIKKGKITRILSYFKYVILAFFVGIVPLAYAFRSFPLPGFCKYICPAGTLEGAMGLLSNAVNQSYLRMLGPLFTWKFLLMIAFLVACVFIFRMFCRFICPLGAIYGFFNKFALIGVKLDKKSCIDCGICLDKCKMDIKHVGDHECIFCGECISACPTGAISMKGPKFIISSPTEAISPKATEEEKAIIEERNKKKRTENTVKTAVTAAVMLALLSGILLYFNVFDGMDLDAFFPNNETEQTEGASGSDDESNSNGEGDSEGEGENVKPPVGTSVGNLCPDISPTILASGEKFDLEAHRGKVVVLNSWYTTCGPCVEELPHFYDVASEYGESVTVLALHIEMPGVDATAWIDSSSGHPEWNDGTMFIGWDDGMKCQNLFNIQACPTTVVIDGNGVISEIVIGSMSHEELIDAVENALNK